MASPRRDKEHETKEIHSILKHEDVKKEESQAKTLRKEDTYSPSFVSRQHGMMGENVFYTLRSVRASNLSEDGSTPLGVPFG